MGWLAQTPRPVPSCWRGWTAATAPWQSPSHSGPLPGAFLGRRCSFFPCCRPDPHGWVFPAARADALGWPHCVRRGFTGGTSPA